MGSRIALGVVTFRRPSELAALLPLLAAQAASVDAEVDVLVVDNDPDGSAAAVCADTPAPRVRYVHEPRPGIAAARTRALRETTEHDLLVFIDDDEVPGDGWLSLLLRTYREHDCAGVVGPVVSSFAVPLDPFVVQGGFFDRRRLPTGSVVDVAATNNLLLDLAPVRAAGLEFDDAFGLTGGSDTLFVRRLVATGARLVWCDEAVVTDVVPPQRCTRDWAVRRRLRIGNSWSLTALALTDRPLPRLLLRGRLLGQGAVRLAGGGARALWGVVARDLRSRAVGTRTAVRGAGLLLGAVGYRYVEYRR